jgi:hypothetical protein
MSEAGRSPVINVPDHAPLEDAAAVQQPVAQQPAIQPADFSAAIAALRQAGAAQLDPLRLHYLELLNARAGAQQGAVQAILNRKLAVAVAELQARLAQAQVQRPESSTAADAVPQPRESLADLTRALAQQGSDPTQTGMAGVTGAPPELKSLRQFRNTWSKLSADKQVTQALDQAPKNAGPINSHMLVLRSLALMRELAPDYLNRFMAYADALLRLEQQQDQQAPASKAVAKTAGKSASSASGKKPAAKRTRAR